MKPGIHRVILTAAWLVVMTAAGVAQSSDVTFQVPLNLTNLSPDLATVGVFCEITSTALTNTSGKASKQVDLVPANGQIIQPAVSVVVPIPFLDTSGGKTSASYRCTLSGYSRSLQRWSPFGDAQTLPVAFRLSPAPANITGTFMW